MNKTLSRRIERLWARPIGTQGACKMCAGRGWPGVCVAWTDDPNPELQTVGCHACGLIAPGDVHNVRLQRCDDSPERAWDVV
jgi:hypothetical protein